MVREGKEFGDKDLEGPGSINLNIQLSWVIFASLVQYVEGGLIREDVSATEIQGSIYMFGIGVFPRVMMRVWFTEVALDRRRERTKLKVPSYLLLI